LTWSFPAHWQPGRGSESAAARGFCLETVTPDDPGGLDAPNDADRDSESEIRARWTSSATVGRDRLPLSPSRLIAARQRPGARPQLPGGLGPARDPGPGTVGNVARRPGPTWRCPASHGESRPCQCSSPRSQPEALSAARVATSAGLRTAELSERGRPWRIMSDPKPRHPSHVTVTSDSGGPGGFFRCLYPHDMFRCHTVSSDVSTP
jgi:hypothetical protein